MFHPVLCPEEMSENPKPIPKQKQLIMDSIDFQVHFSLVSSLSLLGRGYYSETCLQQNRKETEHFLSIAGRLRLFRVISIWIIGTQPKLQNFSAKKTVMCGFRLI
jgi:hypothetical protein